MVKVLERKISSWRRGKRRKETNWKVLKRERIAREEEESSTEETKVLEWKNRGEDMNIYSYLSNLFLFHIFLPFSYFHKFCLREGTEEKCGREWKQKQHGKGKRMQERREKIHIKEKEKEYYSRAMQGKKNRPYVMSEYSSLHFLIASTFTPLFPIHTRSLKRPWAALLTCWGVQGGRQAHHPHFTFRRLPRKI